MPLYRVTIKRTLYLEAEIEADSLEDAHDMGVTGEGDWTDATGGRGLGDDDNEVISVDPIEDEEQESDDETE